KTKAERERGITIECTLLKLDMADRVVNIMDCPGHQDFIKNMVSGTAQADVAVVLVPCAAGEFESAISGGTLKEHILISGALGVPKLIVAVNKVDTIGTDAEQSKRFDEVCKEMKRVCKTIHPDRDPLFVPISGFKGIGLTQKHGYYTWFAGWRPSDDANAQPIFTLEQALKYVPLPKRPFDLDFRGGVTKPLTIQGIGTVITAYCIQGRLNKGDFVSIKPCNVDAEVKTLEKHNEDVKVVEPGESFGMVIKTLNGNIKHVKGGHVISNRDKNPVESNPGYLCTLTVVNHPTGVKINYTPSFVVFMGAVPGRVAKIFKAVHLKTKTTLEDPTLVPKGYRFECVVIPQKPICAEISATSPTLARCGLRDGNKLVAVGNIKQCLKASDLAEMGIKIDSKPEAPVKGADKKKGGKTAAAAGG
ncbi:hypothetical protein EDEG_03076, partial [Edhazardia aedis USNM 41457]